MICGLSALSAAILTVFRTGATGYIGGDALYVLYNKHPEWQYTTLVRTEEKAKQLTAKFPNISVVYGSLDVLEEESKKADIIYRMFWAGPRP